MSIAEQILERMQLGTSGRVYGLGDRERRVTIYSQQVRALNVAWALAHSGRLKAGQRVVVVGAGVAGLTVALGLARKGAMVEVLERNEVILPRFRGNTQRFLHPHIFDWPDPKARLTEAQLPLMNWSAGTASDVATQLERCWEVERSHTQNLKLRLNTAVLTIDEAGRVVHHRAQQRRRVPNSRPIKRLEFDHVILAIGVGTEKSDFGTPAYWENDSLAQANAQRAKVLVSGNGDGGLVDVLRASLVDFDHGQLIGQFLAAADSINLGMQMAAIDVQAMKSEAFDLDAAFAALDLKRIEQLIEGRKRRQRQVTLCVPGPRIYRTDTMALNRVLVECLRRDTLRIIKSKVCGVTASTVGKTVTFENGKSLEFRVTVFRHGPKTDLVGGFRKLAASAPAPTLDAVDFGRTQQWPDSYFSVLQLPRAPDSQPSSYEVIELDAGFGIGSRAWSINQGGQVVGWTFLKDMADHGFFVWSGSGLPPERGNIPGIKSTAAVDINDHGDYVVTTQGGSRQAWLVSGSRLIELRADGDRAMPYAVNNERVVAGWCHDREGKTHPCVWRNGALELLADRGLGGVALDINDAGTIVGETQIDARGRLAATRWVKGVPEYFEPPAPYYTARAFRINQTGLTVGYLMQENKSSDFFIWPPGVPPSIIAQGEAYGVNDDGWVAGRAGQKGAFLWREGKMLWLDQMVDCRWKIQWPFRVTNDLRMVGEARRNGITRAVLLVPRFDPGRI